ncbi:hypothetical protein AAEO56_18750 [Flavobacterium sp. DGU11]|uniref:Outer membrane protein beta-barrel domain-containing protein n=1 Tax=Flavobacterium arundinis TaxID=3139143 RepID=A0ABU9I1L4_9FLAO
MKKYLLHLFVCCCVANSFGQDVTLDKNFKDYTADQIIKTITEGKIAIQIDTATSDIEKLQIRGIDGGFKDIPAALKVNATGYYRYENVDPQAEGGSFDLQITKGDSTKTVKVKVDKKLDDKPGKGCTPITLPTGSKCKARDYAHDFGEEISSYTDKTIVYIYDLDPKVKSAFWKVRKKDGALQKERVKFNRETLTPGKDVQFRIVNVNRLMYDVSVTDSLISYDSEPPALLKRMLIGDDTLLGGLMDTYEEGIDSHSMNESQKSTFETLNRDVACFIENYNMLQEKMLDAFDPCAEFPCCYSVGYLEIANRLANIRNQAGKLQLMMEEEKKELAKNEKNVADCKKLAEDLKKKTAEVAAAKAIAAPADAEEKKKYDKKIKDLEASEAELTKGSGECDVKKTDYEGKIAASKNNLLELAAVTASVASLPTDAELKETIIFLRNMTDQNSYYSLDYIPLDGNVLDLWVRIAKMDIASKKEAPKKDSPEEGAKKEAASGETAPEAGTKVNESGKGVMQYHINIPILWRPFVNFSSGSFAAIGRNLQEKTYSWQEVGNNGGYTLTESGYSNPAAGFSAFANLEWKVSCSVGFGPSVGVGITVEEKPKVAYLVGGSLFLGDKHQLAITGGVAFLQVDRISKNFSESAANQVVYTETQNLDYYKEFKAGLFVSLTYTVFNLTKKK